MKLIKTFVLRQRTRPSEQEAFSMLLECCSADPEVGLDAMSGSGKTPVETASLVREGDVHSMLNELITRAGDRRFLDSARYLVKRYSAKSGPDHEPTVIALVLERDAPGAQVTQSIRELLDRGRQWESLGRTGDAMLCYRVALGAHPDDIDLEFALATLQMRVPPLLPQAAVALRKCREARPERADYAVALAEAYQGALDHKIPFKNTSVESVRAMIVDLLSVANRLAPNDTSIAARLNVARTAADDGGGFFS